MKEFESALRVVKAKAKQHADHQIENDSTDFAQAGLMDFDIPAIEGSRADDDVRAFTNCNVEKLVQLFDRRGKIRIRKQHVFSGRREHTLPNGITFAVVLIIANQTQTLRVESGNDFCRLVGGAVIDNNQVERNRRPADKSIDFANGFGDAAGLIERRDDDGHRRFRCLHKERYCIITVLYERQVTPRVPAPTGRSNARLDDASGRPVPEGIPRHPTEGWLPRTLQEYRSRCGSV